MKLKELFQRKHDSHNDEQNISFEDYFYSDYMITQCIQPLIFKYAKKKDFDTLYYDDFRNSIVDEVSKLLYSQLIDLDSEYIDRSIPESARMSATPDNVKSLIDYALTKDEDLETGTNILNDIFVDLINKRSEEIEETDQKAYEDGVRAGFAMTKEEEDLLVKDVLGIVTKYETMERQPFMIDAEPDENNFIEVIDAEDIKMIDADKEN